MAMALATPAFQTFAEVQTALQNFVTTNNYPIASAPHGVMWAKGKTEADQYAYFTTQDAIPGFPIMQVGSGGTSNIILALSGLPPFDGSTFPQMPPSGPPFLDQNTILMISNWITNGAPQSASTPTG
jgi:hypothetical protein